MRLMIYLWVCVALFGFLFFTGYSAPVQESGIHSKDVAETTLVSSEVFVAGGSAAIVAAGWPVAEW